jgi:hypothetical protein
MKWPSNLRSAVLVVLAACASAAAVMGADDSQATKTVDGDAASPSKPPLVTQNPDGTFTVQKVPPKEGAKGTAKKGLIIPPQVVVPIIPSREKISESGIWAP